MKRPSYYPALAVNVLLMELAPAARSLSFSLRQHRVTSDCGITSLLSLDRSHEPNKTLLFAGNKRGKAYSYLQSNKGELQLLGQVQEEEEESVDVKPFPIYSIACIRQEDKELQLFCAGGDRYITVWQQTTGNTWVRLQRLGPHTGWVKDVLHDCRRDTLHSIGCNCIESWKRTSLWMHAAKRSIESSLKDGATLSSDLLCLCAATDDNDFFFAGGVDGRIHVWSHDVAMRTPLLSIGAHDGRVNAMAYAASAKLLISSGHDGMVQCRRVSSGSWLQRAPDATAMVLDDDGNTLRVTALAVLGTSEHPVDIVLGTSTGELVCFEIVIKEDAIVIEEGSRYHFEESPMINAIANIQAPGMTGESCSYLAVGHSLGLSSITIKR